tara:strand:+ start:81 stop:1208 length:1128 start_codon:yes stop_codon:yes gene_type:complete
MNKYKINQIIKFLGNPTIFVFSVAWMIVLVVVGTIVQKDIGLYQAQEIYFSSWFAWIKFLPIPSGRLLMLLVFINLSFYFFRPNIFKISKIGITITHFGALLLLLGGGVTAYYSQEGRMAINEGDVSNYIEDYYNKELVIANHLNADYDEYITFNEKILYENSELSYSTLPFEFEVIQFFRNCEPVRRTYLGDYSFHGLAKNFYLEGLNPEKEYEKNISGVIINIKGKDVQNNGMYIVYQGQPVQQSITYNGNTFYIAMRNTRTYLPFEIELIDFKKVLHPNTEIPKSFSSDINLIENGIPRHVLIKMNEPLRHKGYTFYQASFFEGEFSEISVLAVVKNYGRLFPYISSIVMCLGILIHLLLKIPQLKRLLFRD